MQKKKKNKLFIFLIICFVLMPFLFTKGCNYMESLNQAENSISEPISSASAYSHIHERVYNAQGHSIRKANWTGTAVPNSGYVGNVYVNTSLDVEDVVSLLETLDFNIPQSATSVNYFLLGKIDGSYTIYINKDTSNSNGIPFYNIGIVGVGTFWAENIGWDLTDNPIAINSDVSPVVPVGDSTFLDIGQQNNILSSLFSITPFIEDTSNELSIGNLFAQLANAILLFGVAVVELFLALEPIFWNNGPTLIFILLIAGVAFALASWGLELLISLIGVFRKKRKKKK